MSTCNFITQDNFPLYVFELDQLEHEWACTDCSCDEYGYPLEPVILEHDGAGYTCPRCGCRTICPEADACHDRRVPQWIIEEWYDDIHAELDEVNADFQNWELRIIDGYYCDVQLIAVLRDVLPEWRMYRYRTWPDDPAASDRPEWAAAEMPRVAEALRDFAELHGFEEFNCVGVFSNGEAVYERSA